MKIIFVILVFVTMVSAIPSCTNYPYKDFSWSDSYSIPLKQSELIEKCLQINSNSPELCAAIRNNSLSENEKKSLILTGFNNSNYFYQIANWNEQIEFTKTPPSDTLVTNGNYIKDAWIAITSIEPSVKNANFNYVNSSGIVNFAYNFSFVIPKESFPNDCNTKYEICGYDYNVQTSNNDQNLVNTRNSVEFSASGVNNFLVVLSVESQYLIHHYKRRLICNGRNCRAVCNYANTEDLRDSIRISDRKQATYESLNYNANVFIENFNQKTVDGWLIVNQINGLKTVNLEFLTSNIQIKKLDYYFNYSLDPYDVLNIESNVVNRIETSKASVLESKIENNSTLIHFLAKTDNLTCKLAIESLFEAQTLFDICKYTTQKPILELNTTLIDSSTFEVEANFYDNSTNTPLVRKNLTLDYSNQSISIITDQNGKGFAVFNYSKQSNLVFAYFQNDFETKSTKAYTLIPRKPLELPVSVDELIGMIIAIAALYLLLRR